MLACHQSHRVKLEHGHYYHRQGQGHKLMTSAASKVKQFGVPHLPALCMQLHSLFVIWQQKIAKLHCWLGLIWNEH